MRTLGVHVPRAIFRTAPCPPLSPCGNRFPSKNLTPAENRRGQAFDRASGENVFSGRLATAWRRDEKSPPDSRAGGSSTISPLRAARGSVFASTPAPENAEYRVRRLTDQRGERRGVYSKGSPPAAASSSCNSCHSRSLHRRKTSCVTIRRERGRGRATVTISLTRAGRGVST